MATIKVELNPFIVPDYVTIKRPPGKREEGIKFNAKIELTELDLLTLQELCEDFRIAVLKKAKQIPDGDSP